MKIKFKLTLGATIAALVLFGSVAAQTNRGTFTDSRDGKIYRIVTIGNQIWMAENLNFATSSGSWCYDNNESNCNTYGRLYDWNTALTICPAGWRLPTDENWQTLINSVGGRATAGRKLKSQSGWAERGSNGSDDFGFSALPGGGRGTDGSFWAVGEWGYWWTASEDRATRARFRLMDYNNEGVIWLDFNKIYGFSVRCVRDEGEN